jgi:hypothetical protein
MAHPPGVIARLQAIASEWANRGPVPDGSICAFILEAAQSDPQSAESILKVLVNGLNTGQVAPVWETGFLGFLNALALVSDGLRAKIASTINSELLEYYFDGQRGDVKRAAVELAETLRVERPRHYFDLARRILIEGSVVVVGAGFSYDSYAPLLREMEGLACSVPHDLGLENPREFYNADDPKVWAKIGEGWRTFQQHVTAMLAPKEPAAQHVLLAEMFHEGRIGHIISFNWDDLIEKAYLSGYGNPLPKITSDRNDSDHALWKLHGDIAAPADRWILPFENGRVFDPLVERVTRTPAHVFIIGYREQERIVKARLIEPLDLQGRITRIRPDLPLSPPETLPDTAISAMKKIRAALDAATRARA